MRLITSKVEDDIYKFKTETGISWQYIIKKGVEGIQNSKYQADLLEEYKLLKEKQARTAALLQKYADEASHENLLDS